MSIKCFVASKVYNQKYPSRHHPHKTAFKKLLATLQQIKGVLPFQNEVGILFLTERRYGIIIIGSYLSVS